MLKDNDNFINTAILSGLTKAITLRDINKQLKNRTVIRDGADTVVTIDGRAIAHHLGKHFFVDGNDLNGAPDEDARRNLRLSNLATVKTLRGG